MVRTFLGCPVYDETPDPCPRCGATVAGNDPVRGECQAPKLNAVVVTDDMVEAAREAVGLHVGISARTMRLALEAGLNAPAFKAKAKAVKKAVEDVAIGHCVSCVSYDHINHCVKGEHCLRRRAKAVG